MDARAARLIRWPLAALLVAVGTGAFVGTGVFTVLEPDTWRSAADDEAGAVSVQLMGDLPLLTMIMGASVLAGAIVALVLWIGGLVWAVHRAFPAGHRLVPAVLTLATAAVLTSGMLTMSTLLTDATRGSGPDLATMIGLVIACCAAACGVFPWWDRRLVHPAMPMRELVGTRALR